MQSESWQQGQKWRTFGFISTLAKKVLWIVLPADFTDFLGWTNAYNLNNSSADCQLSSFFV